jgi:lysophospholipase L1-like esterase
MITLLCGVAFGILSGMPNSTRMAGCSIDTQVVVCFGNSTTAPRKGLEMSYPERLAEHFREAATSAVVFNAGRGGNHTGRTVDNGFHRGPHASERFDQDVIARHPDWVIICFGINDAWQDQGKGTASRITSRDYRRNLLAFQSAIDRQGGKTIFLGPNPLGDKYPPFRMKRLRRYHRITKRVARSTGSFWINTFRLFGAYERTTGTKRDQLLLDGMHPNDTGHDIITQAIRRMINQPYQPDTP